MDEDPRIALTLQAVIDGRSLDPFAVLGPHRTVSGAILRVMVPGARLTAARGRASSRSRPAASTRTAPS